MNCLGKHLYIQQEFQINTTLKFCLSIEQFSLKWLYSPLSMSLMNDFLLKKKKDHQFIFKLKPLETNIFSLHILLLRGLVFCQGNILINLNLQFSLSCEHSSWLPITQEQPIQQDVCIGFIMNVSLN